MVKTISRNDPCFCGSGKKYKKCHSDIHPESRAARLIQTQKKYQRKIEDYQKSTGNIPPCHKGCYNCCYEDFSITEIEFEFIMRELKTWSKERVEQIYDTALGQCETIKNERPDTWRNLESYVPEDDGTLLFEQMNQHMATGRNSFPCPLLDPETKSCSVYDSRPLVCRSFGSTHHRINETRRVAVCEHIPDSVEHAAITPTVDDEAAETKEYVNLRLPDGKLIHQRPYPIYYWFKIFYDRTGKKEAQYNHYDSPVNFNQPLEQANLYTLKGFNLI
ncbi:YkgJ family cysteine cluster protein (plasmid) [Bacillus licheniformis]|uniref:YkgJ family cysteine cluster protein n=1 Tax=Bacillus licheniformis TaxID=1402 RepID=UPI002ACA8A5D|nr:YkgJ family cysteine cluster protein [Bacillus licheniformis]MDZ5539995.1 YkgJ family cysteine cluster protein [Bacillus licheniformis]